MKPADKTCLPSRNLPRSLRLRMWGAALLMYFGCMLFPLVGKAGSQTAHARGNFLTVLGLMLAGLLLGGTAGYRLWKSQPSGRGFRLWTLFVFSQVLALICLLGGAFGV